MAVAHRPGEGEHIGGLRPSRSRRQAETPQGSLYLGEAVAQPGFAGPPPHRHRHLHDMFEVLEGVLTVMLGEETLELEAGSFVCLPSGTVHTSRTVARSPPRFLNLQHAGGLGELMRDLGELLASGDPRPEEIGRIASRYDFEIV